MQGIPLKTKILYGPVKSRRLGRSLGLNLSPKSYKWCSFNCVYCQYSWTTVCSMDATSNKGELPTVADFESVLGNALREHLAGEIDNITFSGNGEPTLHPHFPELVDITRGLRERYYPGAKVGVLSNSSTVVMESVRQALARLDFRIMKLDAGDPQTFQAVNRPCPEVNYQAVVDGLKSLENVTIQTMFIDGSVQNTGEREVDAWMERLKEIAPVSAQIYSLHRPPAASSLKEVPPETLHKIALRAEKEAGIRVEVIVAARPYTPTYGPLGG
jgi:wyosine [tRNA(Phe)-imidazoG37] synthetase (radical SAM superfamily)